MAGRAAGKIADLLNFSSSDKMMQMIAWSSFLAGRCQGLALSYNTCISMLPVTGPIFNHVKNSASTGRVLSRIFLLGGSFKYYVWEGPTWSAKILQRVHGGPIS